MPNVTELIWKRVRWPQVGDVQLFQHVHHDHGLSADPLLLKRENKLIFSLIIEENSNCDLLKNLTVFTPEIIEFLLHYALVRSVKMSKWGNIRPCTCRLIGERIHSVEPNPVCRWTSVRLCQQEHRAYALGGSISIEIAWFSTTWGRL